MTHFLPLSSGVGRHLLGRLALITFAVLGAALPAAAVTHHVDVLLDLDNDAATGCTVDTAGGPFEGVEQILRSVVETESVPAPAATVVDVVRFECVGGATFGPALPVDAGDWPVGVGLGVSGSDVVETYFPGDALPAGLAAIRFGVTLTALGSGEEAALLFTQDGQPILLVLQSILEIPTLSEWGLLLLAALLALAAAHRLRRRTLTAALAALLALGGAGLAWAAVSLDGDPSDWGVGTELASTPPAACNGLRVAALFAKSESGQLCLRIDACLNFNTAPVAADDAFTTPEDTPLNGNVLADNGSGADEDVDGDTLTVDTTPLAGPSNGTLVLAADGAFTYTPNADFNGTDSFEYQITDGNGGSDTATVTITVTAVNDAPVADPQAVTTDEDVAAPIALTGSDVDGDALTFAIASNPANGTLSGFDPNTGAVTYTPNADFNGADSFTFTVSDGTATSPAATVSITVGPVNDTPVADAQSVSTNEDVAAPITLTGSDVDGDAPTFAIASNPANGSLSGFDANTGAVTYTPNADFNGADSFTFTVSDGTATSPAATVSITVDPVNDAPVADAQSVSTNEDVAAPITLTGSDVDGDSLTFAIATNPANGTLSGFDGSTGAVTYTPGADFNGADSFTFTVNDGTATSAAATVSITVNPVNDPAVVDLDADGSEGTAGSDFALAYTENDGPQPLLDPTDATITDIDSTTLSSVTLTLTNLLDAGQEVLAADASGFPSITVQAFDTTTTPGQGVLVISAATPQPIADFVAVLRTATYEHTGDDPHDTEVREIDVVANDGGGDGPAATSRVTMTAVNDAPVADAQSVTTDEDVAAPITLTGSDLEGETLTFAIDANPANGTLSGFDASTGAVTYTPNADFNGADSFTFTVDDGTVTSAAATVSITVDSVNDAPAADAQSVTTDEDVAAPITLTGSDVDGDSLTFAIATNPANGTLSGFDASSGAVTYTPNANFNGADSFTFTVDDGTATSAAATVSITVNAVNDAPVAGAQSVTTDEDVATPITLTGSDVDGDSLTFAIATNPANGMLSGFDASTGAVTYTPGADFNGADSFTFTASDGAATSPAATVSITVDPVNDAPVADAQSVTTDEDVAAPITLTGSDVDGDTLTFAIATNPANGTLSGFDASSGAVTYTPNANFNGADSFTFTVTDGTATSPAATVSITVNPVNDPPVAIDDAASITEEAPNVAAANEVSGNVLTNDTDVDSTLTVSAVAGGSVGSAKTGTFGSVIINSDGSYIYALDDTNPTVNALAPGQMLTDAFGYTASDGEFSDSATLTVTIHGADDPATPDDDAFDFIGNTELRVDLAAASTPHALETTAPDGIDGVLEGDVDPDGGPAITVSGIVGCTDPTAPFDCVIPNEGTVSLEADGSFSFVPVAGDADPTATFQYTLTGNAVNVGTVTLTRSERVWYVKNDAAAGGDGTSTAPFDAITAANLNDNDGDGDLTDDLDAAGDHIFVFFGNGTTSGQSTGLFLEGGQHLIGEHAGLSLNVDLNGNGAPTVLVAAVPGNRPLFDDTVADGFDGVAARDVVPAEIVGMNLAGNVNAIDWTTTAAFAGTGTYSIRDNVIRSAGGEGVDVNLAGTGAVALAFHDNTLTSTGTAVDIQETGTGTLTIRAFDDNVVNGNTGGSGIVVNSAIFDALAGAGFDPVSGGITSVGDSGNSVGGAGMVLTAVQGSLSFDDLDVFGGTTGLTVGGTGGGMTFAVTPASPSGSGTSVIRGANGAALDLSNVTIDLQLDDLDSTSTASGIVLSSVGGQLRTDTDASISKSAGGGVAFSIASSSATVNYGGTLTVTSGGGVSLTNNTGPVNFTGQLALSTGANPAFSATGAGGTVIATHASNTLTTTTATALNVNGPDIGVGGLVFRSIAANGASNGIVLRDTGTTAGLTVSGTGTTPGSGGTIQNISGRGGSFVNASAITLKNMNFTNTATSAGAPCGSAALVGGNTGCHAAIHLHNVSNVSLDRLNVTTSGQQGINGIDVTGFTLSNSSLSSLGNGADEDGLHFLNLLGTNAITGTTITSSGDDNINIQNRSSTASTINVFGGSFDNAVLGSGLLFGIRDTANTTINITGVTSDNNFSGGIVADGFDTATLNIVVSGAQITNNNDGIQVSANNGTSRFDIDNNDFIGNDFLAVSLLKAAFSTAGALEGAVRNNNPISVGNGRTTDAISVFQAGGGALKVAITNNTFSYAGTQRVMLVQAGQDGNGSLDTTITGNSIDIQLDGTGNAVAGILAQSAITGPGVTSALCADIGGAVGLSNTFTHSLGGSMAAGDIRVRQRNDGTVRLPGYAGGATDTAAVATYLSSRNTVVSTPTASAQSTGFAGGAACSQPTLP